jgi:hypothetical protein
MCSETASRYAGGLIDRDLGLIVLATWHTCSPRRWQRKVSYRQPEKEQPSAQNPSHFLDLFFQLPCPAANMKVANLLLTIFFSMVCPTLGAFLPVSTRNEGSSLRPRKELQRECLQPASTIELHYMEGMLAPVLLP